MPPRNKKIVEEVQENAVEQPVIAKTVEPVEEPEVESDDSIVKRVVSKVKQVITLKKILTPKQQAHLDRLAATRLGKKTTYKEIQVEIPQKKKRTVKPKVEPIPEPIPVKAVRKPRPKTVPAPVQIIKEPINLSRFNKNLF